MTNDKPEPTQDAGPWRFSRLDGRFVFDCDDGRKGFHSPLFKDAEAFAVYATRLEAEIAALTRERDEMKHAATVATEEMHRFWGRARKAEAELETLRAHLTNLLLEMGGVGIHNSASASRAMGALGAKNYAALAEASPAVGEENDAHSP